MLMRQVPIQPSFDAWQSAARDLLRLQAQPDQVLWTEENEPQSMLPLGTSAPTTRADNNASPHRVPKAFIATARTVALHAEPQKWSLLYRVLWRLTHGESKLLEVPVDPDTITLTRMRHEVEKDAYRMRAFLRFRETRLNTEPWFVAWYEPEHDTVQLNERFFVERFASMRWSILTPNRCMHWDGQHVTYSSGVTKSSAPTGDAMERLWVAYYSSTFNPARFNPEAMQAQLLKRNWKNLPEAAVIEPLLREAPRRTSRMLARSEFFRERPSDYSVAAPPPGATLEELKAGVGACRACPLWKTASCAVFGEGPRNARVVLVGEQPGDQEDRAGRPFIGPAGQVLDRALAEAQVDRKNVYVTNAVKHFKFEPSGKRRIHKTPNARDIAACRPWLLAELNVLKPELIVTLGATAARSVFDAPIRISAERGRIHQTACGRTLVTMHPSALLRLPPGTDFELEFERLVADLRLIGR
jgi:uracil-DNA glycosylase